jgi:ketosteroid isomerase-like protein
MSQENVEFVRAIVSLYEQPEGIALLASGDLDLSMVDADVEWDASEISEMIPDLAGIYHGHEGVRAYWRRWMDAWKDLEFEVHDLRDAGDQVVVLIRNQRQAGRHTGIVTELPPYGMVFTVRAGKLMRWSTFPSHESALAAVGLAE